MFHFVFWLTSYHEIHNLHFSKAMYESLILKLKGTLHMMMSRMLISTSFQEMKPQVPTMGLVFCITITSRYPGKMFRGGRSLLVSPHSVLVSTSRSVNMDQLDRLRMHLTPEPLLLPFILTSDTVDWFRDSPGLTRAGWRSLEKSILFIS